MTKEGFTMLDIILENQKPNHNERINHSSKLTDKDFLLMEMFGVG